ncbi:hypothetical protein, partial [Sphaerisporangium fuscum]|uniref:hypothetical protein n=1 Tax=Sphaerisporangium fuscum TaxID=2835868 RepID=UPI001BDD0CA6
MPSMPLRERVLPRRDPLVNPAALLAIEGVVPATDGLVSAPDGRPRGGGGAWPPGGAWPAGADGHAGTAP